MIRLFRVFIPTTVVGLLLSEAVLVFAAYLAPAFFLVEDPGLFLLYENGVLRIGIVVGSILFGLYLNDLYTQLQVRSRILLVQQICLVLGVAFLVQAFFGYLDAPLRMPRWSMMAGSALCLVGLPAWRIFYNNLVFKVMGGERILFLGDSPVLRQIASQIAEKPELGWRSLGFVTDQIGPGEDTLGPPDRLKSIVASTAPSRIVVGFADRRRRLPVYDLLDISLTGTLIEEAGITYETAFGRVCLSELRPGDLIFSNRFTPRRRHVIVQSLYCAIVGFVGVVLTLPLMALVAIAVKLTSSGPALFRQTRVGLNGKLFTLYKFRSMRVDAEAVSGAVWAIENDPRITPLGRWLRLLRLDELPQLFNVLKGEMAIVGPRPERPEFVKILNEQIPFYIQRHRVKPGITGWAQINYRYGNTVEDAATKLEYDLYYLKNLSMALDFFVMFHTVKTMLLQRGAY